MTESIDTSDRDAQMMLIYQSLGRFVVEFSRIVSAMEAGITFSAGGDQQVVRAIVIELTADPLARAWRSAMNQVADLSEDDVAVLAGLTSEISALINLRNDWSHGAWFVGYGNETTVDWSKAGLGRLKNSAKGVKSPAKLNTEPTAQYIDKAATHASIIADAVHAFSTIAVMRRLGQISNTHPSERVRIAKIDGRRQVQVTQDGSSWRSSEWA